MAGELRPVVFALDAGATTTRAVVVDEDGVVLWREQSAGASLTRRDFDEALEQIRRLWEEAAGYVEDLPSRLRGVAAGFAGGRSTSVRMEMGRRLADLCSGSDLSSTLPVTVTHDAHIALLGAHGSEGAACVLISGTGSICMARDEQGTTTLAGGWGWPLGDEGSAVWLGWRATRRALAAWEESRPTPLAALLIEAWEIDPDQAGDPHSVMRRAAGAAHDPELYARLAPGVFTCAGDGDSDALELVHETGLELGTLISQACTRLGFDSGREIPVALTGGLAASRELVLRDPIRKGAGSFGPDLTFVKPRLPAEGGAALLALTAAGPEPSSAVLTRLEKNLRSPAVVESDDPAANPARH